MISCPACAAENPDGARFCNACGGALGDAPAAGREERKVVTVLFCDLVGFTSRAERLDPEDVRALLSGYHGRLRAQLERHGGTVEKFIGDAVMAVFGAPTAHEDDPERAVRAALAIRDEIAEDAGEAGRELHVRIGITTGEALVRLGAHPESGEGMAAGDVVNTAARLQSAAPVDGVLVDETTCRATERAISFQAAEPVTAKGKSDPVPAWEAVEVRARLGVDVARTAQTPLVGREHEVETVVGALGRARRERAAQLVTIVGVPGMGKSRLVQELLAAVEADEELIVWRQGRSLPYGEDASFAALSDIVKAQAGILETDDGEAAAEKLHQAIAGAVGEAEEAAWVERHLRPLVGLSRAADAGRDESFAAWRRFVESLAEDGPAVLVLEDLHWADDGLLDFVDHLADWAGAVPLLVVCTARPELFARRPSWGGGKPNATTLSLAPLSDEETARLVAALLERSVIPAELQQALLARAGGNPLYAEEFTRMAVERGAANLAEALPETVQGIIAARLDGLDQEDKALLQDAAVVGKVFWLGAVAAIGSRDRFETERRLHELERRQFVRRERRSSVGGEAEYAFWHLLVRDVAYGQIPRAERADRHAAAAAWIAGLGERLDDRSEQLAHHYGAAVHLARAAGRDTTALEAPARAALAAAGERALRLSAWAAAESAFTRALDLDPADAGERGRLLLGLGLARAAHGAGEDEVREARDLLIGAGEVERAARAESELAEIVWFRGAASEALEHARHAAAMLEGRPPSSDRTFVMGALSRFLMIASLDDEAIAVGREALAMAEELGLVEEQAAILNNIGSARTSAGELGGIEDLERSIEIAERIGSLEAVRGYINLASSLQWMGEQRRASAMHERGLALARPFGYAGGIRHLEAERTIDLVSDGRWDEALTEAARFLAAVEAGAPHYMEPAVRIMRSTVFGLRGAHDAALDDARRAVELARATDEPQILLPTLTWSALAHDRAGDADETARLARELLERSADGRGAQHWLFPGLVLLDRTGLLAEGRRTALPTLDAPRAATRAGGAARCYLEGDKARAADILRDGGSRLDEALVRLQAAEGLAGDGRHAEASVQARAVLAFAAETGATELTGRASQLLAAAG